jgi:hypothetical protein
MLLELEPPMLELEFPCSVLEDEFSEPDEFASLPDELEPPVPTKSSGCGGISTLEVHERINAMASARAAVRVITFIVFLLVKFQIQAFNKSSTR